jgi:hypothetical protein
VAEDIFFVIGAGRVGFPYTPRSVSEIQDRLQAKLADRYLFERELGIVEHIHRRTFGLRASFLRGGAFRLMVRTPVVELIVRAAGAPLVQRAAARLFASL